MSKYITTGLLVIALLACGSYDEIKFTCGPQPLPPAFEEAVTEEVELYTGPEFAFADPVNSITFSMNAENEIAFEISIDEGVLDVKISSEIEMTETAEMFFRMLSESYPDVRRAICAGPPRTYNPLYKKTT